ncbi:acetyltransferase [Paenibacillus motobuensis]|uniref:GNAT family N-acetyltransferase n=1 Tax=Paenibacillus TaxID=44249 RepID=UPI0020400E77|nr:MULTISPECIES: GNAT family N-acetyltransferase [Paenibacillus]MCM3038182.1 acetyltransferase [Paenibacillus lutimineralis]MCM3645286.1 acetyltransferase [Paenibacillus motobuensis]
MIYRNDKITVRSIAEADQQLLADWLSNPEVLQYYEGRDRPHDLEMVRERFYLEDDETRCIVEYEGQAIGYIQFYLLEEDSRLEYGYTDADGIIYGTDQFIGDPGYWNRGIGKKLVSSMRDYLIHQRKAAKVVMDPQAWNARALACYEQCGFVKKKLLKEHELHEGQLRDCWLIECTAESAQYRRMP